tara:strand:+ start:358 stop:603 length:246 start_codon:yes stop_codon:yes gene_type:complete
MQDLSLTVHSQKDKTDYQIDIIENYKITDYDGIDKKYNYLVHVVALNENHRSMYEFGETIWDFENLKEVYWFLKQIEKYGL